MSVTSGAVQVACLSQSAISQAIRRLEEEVGASLLERGRPPQLTASGRRLCEHAIDTLGRDELVKRQIAELQQGHAAIVVLAASQALSRLLLPSMGGRFTRARSTAGLQLRVEDQVSGGR